MELQEEANEENNNDVHGDDVMVKGHWYHVPASSCHGCNVDFFTITRCVTCILGHTNNFRSLSSVTFRILEGEGKFQGLCLPGLSSKLSLFHEISN